MPIILWVDDEIDRLKAHQLFLAEKGYEIDTCNNGMDAYDLVKDRPYDAVFLDENMPGWTGLETLEKMKELRPALPVVMVTKSEEEAIMEMAIGNKIADYLVKPVNPHQLLLCLKKILQTSELVSKQTTQGYQKQFGRLTMEMQGLRSWDEWVEFYRKLLSWELKLQDSADEGLQSVLATQKQEANELFSKFIASHYEAWFIQGDGPLMSHQWVHEVVAPLLENGEKVFMLVMDNLRFDQWLELKASLSPLFRTEREELYASILPSATQYARNALFAGMMPADIKRHFPDYWKEEGDEGSKNQFEGALLQAQLDRLGLGAKRMDYHKVTNVSGAKKYLDHLHQRKNMDLVALVYNFVDMLSHAKTDTEVIRELAADDAAYRKITKTWFENSALLKVLQWAAKEGFKVVLTTDHGTINVGRPSKVVGKRHMTTNLRFKSGQGMTYQAKHSMVIAKPSHVGLPTQHIAEEYIFALSDFFYAYPNNYNHYVSYYRNTYQHGGVSLEELMIPYVVLQAK